MASPMKQRGMRRKKQNGEKRKKESEDRILKKYTESGKLCTLICNQCGKRLIVQDGIVKEGFFDGSQSWDFFSEKDGEIHRWDLCESCYDELISGFRIAVETEEQVEFM